MQQLSCWLESWYRKLISLSRRLASLLIVTLAAHTPSAVTALVSVTRGISLRFGKREGGRVQSRKHLLRTHDEGVSVREDWEGRQREGPKDDQ